jgi:hypothetical protein
VEVAAAAMVSVLLVLLLKNSQKKETVQEAWQKTLPLSVEELHIIKKYQQNSQKPNVVINQVLPVREKFWRCNTNWAISGKNPRIYFWLEQCDWQNVYDSTLIPYRHATLH